MCLIGGESNDLLRMEELLEITLFKANKCGIEIRNLINKMIKVLCKKIVTAYVI